MRNGDDNDGDDSGPGHYTGCDVDDDDERPEAICETGRASILCSSTFAEDYHHHHYHGHDYDDEKHYDSRLSRFTIVTMMMRRRHGIFGAVQHSDDDHDSDYDY